jgi:Coenzyme F390 synthetase
MKLENKIWDKSECLSRDEIENIQVLRLRETVKRVQNVPFYAKKLKELGIGPEDIKSVADIKHLPFTTKTDMRENYPLGLMAVPKEKVIRFHGSSGTTGKPTFVAYTKNDLEMWSDMVARFLYSGGARPGHTAQISFGYGLFTGGFGLHYGLEKIGSSIIPAASGNTRRQFTLLQDLQPELLVCTPTYALRLIEYMEEEKIQRESLNLKVAFLGSEPWTEEMRLYIEERLQVNTCNNYGLSEVIGPGISGECVYHTGMHIQEDYFLVECLDPETLEPVPDGQLGELVITALNKEAMPMIRYRTRDLAYIIKDDSPCPCGRTTKRMSRIKGRSDDMVIIRGVNVFPSQVEEALLQCKDVTPNFLIVLDRPGSLDRSVVKVEMSPAFFSDKMSEMQMLKNKLEETIRSYTGIHFEVDLVQPQTIERFTGKAARVVDNRPKEN